MKQLLSQHLPHPFFDLYPQFPQECDKDVDVNKILSKDQILTICRQFNLQSALNAPIELDQDIIKDQVVQISEEESTEIYIPKSEEVIKDFSIQGCSRLELYQFYDQLSKGIVFIKPNGDTDNYLSGVSCYQIYKLNNPSEFNESLLYLCQLALTRQEDIKIVKFAQKIIYLFKNRTTQNFPTIIRVSCILDDIWLLKEFHTHLDLNTATELLNEQISNNSISYIINNFIDQYQFLLAIIDKQQYQFLLNETLPNLDKTKLFIIQNQLNEIIEVVYSQGQICTNFQFNSAIIFVNVLKQIFCDPIETCINCQFPCQQQICFRCQYYSNLTNYEFDKLIKNSLEYVQLLQIEQNSNQEIFIDNNVLIEYLIQQSNCINFVNKLLLFFINNGNISQINQLLQQWLGLVQLRVITQDMVSIIFQQLFIHEKDSIQQIGFENIGKLCKLNIKLFNILEQIIYTANKSLNKLDSQVKINKYVKQTKVIYQTFAFQCFIDNDINGLALLQNLVSNISLQITIQFDFQFQCSELDLFDLLDAIKNKRQNDLYSNIISFSQLGLLTDSTIITANIEKSVHVLNFLLENFIDSFDMNRIIVNFTYSLVFMIKINKQTPNLEKTASLINRTNQQQIEVLKQLLLLVLNSNTISFAILTPLLKHNNLEIQCLGYQLIGKFHSREAELYRRKIQQKLLSNLENMTFKLQLFSVSKYLDQSQISQVDDDLLNDQLFEEMYFQAHFIVSQGQNTTELNNQIKVCFSNIQERLAGLIPKTEKQQLYSSLISFQSIQSGVTIPKTALKMIIPILLNSKNESVLHSTKQCLHSLVKRFQSALRFEFYSILKDQTITHNLNVLTWLYVFQHVQIEERQLLGIRSRLLSANLIYCGLRSGSIKLDFAVQNWFLDEYYQRLRDQAPHSQTVGIDQFVEAVCRQ